MPGMDPKVREDLGALAVRLQRAVREGRLRRAGGRARFFQALEVASGGSMARAVDLLGDVAEEEGLPVSVGDTALLMAAVATFRELSGTPDPVLRPLMASGTRAAGLGRRLGLRLFRRPDSNGLARLLEAPLQRMRRDSGAARRTLSEMRRRWHSVRRLLSEGPSGAAGFS